MSPYQALINGWREAAEVCRKCGLPKTSTRKAHGKVVPKCIHCARESDRRRRKIKPCKPSYASQKRWRLKYPEKYRAHMILHGAIRTGSIVRPEYCSKCGLKCRTQAHHSDYSKPLDVAWLCVECHNGKHYRPLPQPKEGENKMICTDCRHPIEKCTCHNPAEKRAPVACLARDLNKIRIAVAEACGWIRPFESHPKCWVRPASGNWSGPFRHAEGKNRYLEVIPDFTADLNACAEFERTLTKEEAFEYLNQLGQICKVGETGCEWWIRYITVRASALHRCLAFLAVKGINV